MNDTAELCMHCVALYYSDNVYINNQTKPENPKLTNINNQTQFIQKKINRIKRVNLLLTGEAAERRTRGGFERRNWLGRRY